MIIRRNLSLVSTRSLVTVLTAIFVLTIIMMPQQGYAATLSKTFSDPGTYEIFFRHPDSTTSTADPVITFDKNFYHNGDAGILTINDFNANADRNMPDTISADR